MDNFDDKKRKNHKSDDGKDKSETGRSRTSQS